MLCGINAWSAETKDIQFSVRPHLCVLAKSESHCQDQFTVEWKSRSEHYFSLCVFHEGNENPVACWKDANRGSAEVALLLEKTTTFELRDSADQKIVGRDIFEVMYTGKKYQGARRNPWSFF